MRFFNKKILLSIAGIMLLIVSVLAFQYVMAGMGISLAAGFISSLVEKGSGKLGKDVIVNGRNGPYLRLRVKPRNPKSPAQMTGRGLMTALTREWRGLPTLTKAAFNDFAAVTPTSSNLGVKRVLTGFQWFVKINRPLVEAGVPEVYNPAGYSLEAGNLQPSIPVPTITYDLTTKLLKTFTLNFAALPVGLGATYLVLKVTSPLSQGVTSWKGRKYILLQTVNTTSITQPIDIFAAYTAIFQIPNNVLNTEIFLEFYQIDSVTGNMSPKQYTAINMVPPVV